MKPNVIIIMAGGLGKRMNSELPKVLHKINGKPLLLNVVQESMLLTPLKHWAQKRRRIKCAYNLVGQMETLPSSLEKVK